MLKLFILSWFNSGKSYAFSSSVGYEFLRYQIPPELEFQTVVSSELNPGPLEEQTVLLTAEPSLQPPLIHYNYFVLYRMDNNLWQTKLWNIYLNFQKTQKKYLEL
ncbi:hypothetical protein STEG23_016315, partial [Scotinomys teguina]